MKAMNHPATTDPAQCGELTRVEVPVSQSKNKPKNPMISFKTSKYETGLLSQITTRAVAMAIRYGVDYTHQTCVMDLCACHANGNPLDLDAMLKMPDSDFAHDIFGIRRHIDRRTGKLGECFVPRCSLPEHATE